MPWFLRPRRLIQAVVLATVAFALWQMSVPNLVCGPINASESAAIATLKNLHDAEHRLLAQKAIDCDGDGRGEAGFFEELTGSRPLRWAKGVSRRRLEPRLLGPVFDGVDGGLVHWCGYYFRIHLPTADGRWVGAWEHAGAVGADASENGFCIYAWPDGETSGRRAFFVDASGTVLSCKNDGWRYCGRERPVPVDAALPSSDAGRDEEGPGGHIGRDGQRWTVVE